MLHGFPNAPSRMHYLYAIIYIRFNRPTNKIFTINHEQPGLMMGEVVLISVH